MAKRLIITRLAGGIALAAAVFMAGAQPAMAHAELVSSTPAEGSIVEAAPTMIVLEFSEATEPAGDPIRLVDQAGEQIPATIVQTSDTVIEIYPDQDLKPGSHGVVWSMKAGDQHPITGVVTFGIAESSEAAATDAAVVPSAPTARIPIESPDAAPVVAAIEIERARSVIGDLLGPIGRWIALMGILIGIGSLAFAATVLTGSREEVRNAAYWVRRSGVAVLLGTMVEAAAAIMVINGSALAPLWPPNVWDVVWSTFGVAILLRLAGGVAMTIGMGLIDVAGAGGPARFGARPTEPRSPVQTVEAPVVASIYRTDLSHSVVAVMGTVAVALSYLFDGHTVTASPGLLVKVSDLVHVVGAGVWLGGVLMLSWVLTDRYRGGVPLQAGALAVRFSRIAGMALGAVGAAGLILTWAILDTPSELVSTPWGRLLLLKIAVVAVAASIGAYNHRYVVPTLELNGGDTKASDELRRTIRIEGFVLVAVVAATAVLVGLSS